MTSQVKYFTEVILTHACSYPLTDYVSTLNYSVGSSNFAFGAENKNQANFDIRYDELSSLLRNALQTRRYTARIVYTMTLGWYFNG